MNLRSIIINVDHKRRVVIDPEGGYDLEAWVKGIGWVIDNDAHCPDDMLSDLFEQTGKIALRLADRLNTWQADRYTEVIDGISE